jgi:hypothetical protein
MIAAAASDSPAGGDVVVALVVHSRGSLRTLTPGSSLGAYEILAVLGSGGMGVVYRARDSRLQRDVALKVLPTEWAGDPERLARFKREAQLLAALSPGNIGAIFGFEDAQAQRRLGDFGQSRQRCFRKPANPQKTSDGSSRRPESWACLRQALPIPRRDRTIAAR